MFPKTLRFRFFVCSVKQGSYFVIAAPTTLTLLKSRAFRYLVGLHHTRLLCENGIVRYMYHLANEDAAVPYVSLFCQRNRYRNNA